MVYEFSAKAPVLQMSACEFFYGQHYGGTAGFHVQGANPVHIIAFHHAVVRWSGPAVAELHRIQMPSQIYDRPRFAAVHDAYHIFPVEFGLLWLIESMYLSGHSSFGKPPIYKFHNLVFVEIEAFYLHQLSQEFFVFFS